MPVEAENTHPDLVQESRDHLKRRQLADLKFPYYGGPTWEAILEEWNDNLCYRCRELLSLYTPEYNSSRTHLEEDMDGERISSRSHGMIQQYLELGCNFCSAVKHVTQQQGLWSDDAAIDRRNNIDSSFDLSAAITIQYVNASTIAVLAGSASVHEVESRACLIKVSDPDCLPDGLGFIREQLANCLDNPYHDCERLLYDANGNDWPARMLQIRRDRVFLVDFDSTTMPGSYAALSYCWGDKSELQQNPPYMATTSTVEQLKMGIPSRSLPLTLGQGVTICKKLGIDYIWIDSLCILQDVRSDWETEAAKMESVYSRSRLTIIAAASTSCHSGFLNVDLGLVELSGVPLPPELRLVTQDVKYSGFHSLSGGLALDPIDRRGWTYQEELLSTRYVKVTDSDIQWKCNAGTTCLCGFGADPECLIQLNHTDREGALSKWNSVVSNFSRRQFTVATDKLPAISSIARKLGRNIQSQHNINGGKPVQYFAGEWCGGSIGYSQLLWFTVEIRSAMSIVGAAPKPPRSNIASGNWHQVPTNSVTDLYVAPSFSWASVDLGPNSTMTHQNIRDIQHHLAQIISITTPPELADNPFGIVTSGSIVLRAPLLRTSLCSHPADPSLVHFGALPEGFAVDRACFDCPVVRSTLKSGKRCIQRLTSCHQGVGISTPFEETEAGIMLCNAGYSLWSSAHAYWGILLGRVEQGYQRIGLVILSPVWQVLDEEAQRAEFKKLEQFREEIIIF
ncbi:heterokaryon incompatibility protein-domain-containing protein [Cladorrhinum sp. PSN332]|nr:heterokaryon incompatibility protein-domain-containing protein [Cladorrhinum sp. PSN332]